ncbi:hypothetical protein [Streptomyces sp. NPDC060131]|uniref:hypothetical protein n=1 Tax=unclassified Streptomyces TaxID=2593676 RepID=UPI00364AFEE0
MPTYETLPRFTTDLNRLTPEQRHRFRQTVNVVTYSVESAAVCSFDQVDRAPTALDLGLQGDEVLRLGLLAQRRDL